MLHDNPLSKSLYLFLCQNQHFLLYNVLVYLIDKFYIFLHLRFNRFAFMLTEEGFARTAESVDTRRVARLQQDKYNNRECSKRHKSNQYDTKRTVDV